MPTGLSKAWTTVESDEAGSSRLAGECSLPLPLARILVSRGVSRKDDADRFLNPRLSDLSDPFGLPAMAAAVDRIWSAIDKREKIVVYGDYDADGVMATAVMVGVLGRLGGDVAWCLPSRREEGYGFSEAGLERCENKYRPSLIITVDCGSNDIAAVNRARNSGMDVVVTDHHEVHEKRAEPLALVNPRLCADENVRVLAGAGVAFKVCHALVKKGRERGAGPSVEIDLRDYLDRVAIATVADVVPLTGENRILVRHGIECLRRRGNIGLKAVMASAGMQDDIRAYHLGFVIGPRFNAVGRIGDADSALELLLADDPVVAERMAARLEDANRERMDVERLVVDEARAEVERSFKPGRDFGLVVGREGWHAGVIGLVASKLSAAYMRPAVVVSFDDKGEGRGSGRSIPQFDLVAALKECSEFLVKFGGHRLAAGFTLKRDRFEGFRARFKEVCSAGLEGQDIRPVQRIDSWIDLGGADRNLVDGLERMEPFGEGNPAPVWAVRGVRIVGQPRILKDTHLKMTLAAGGSQLDAIAFGMAGREIPDGPMDVAFALKRDTYRGRDSLQMEVKDFRPGST